MTEDIKKVFQPSLRNKFLVEIVGTFILVYAIASAATVYSDSGQLGVIGIGLVHALVLTAIVYAIGYRSGAQVNPAVTIGLLVAKKISGKEAAVYIIAQIIGAVIAAVVVYSIFGSEMSASVTLPSEDNIVRALILETVMTFTLVYVVLATTTSKNFKIVPASWVSYRFYTGSKCHFWRLNYWWIVESSPFFWPCLNKLGLCISLDLLDSSYCRRINSSWSI